MRADFLDRYSHGDSPIHRLPAGLKLASALALAALLVMLPPRVGPGFLLAGAVLGAVTATSRVPVSFLAWRILLLEPFVLGVALLSLLDAGGLPAFLSLVLRSTLCLLTMLLLASTTPFSQILSVLRRLGMPALLLTTLALMYRYLFVMVDEAERMQRARASRTFVQRRSRQWQTLATVVGHLFIRASERAQRIHRAMVARGWR